MGKKILVMLDIIFFLILGIYAIIRMSAKEQIVRRSEERKTRKYNYYGGFYINSYYTIYYSEIKAPDKRTIVIASIVGAIILMGAMFLEPPILKYSMMTIVEIVTMVILHQAMKSVKKDSKICLDEE